MSQTPPDYGRQRQTEIYVQGMAGWQPTVPANMAHLEQQARQRMSPEAFAYIAGGAGMESTVSENRRAFERWRIVPRMLKDVATRNTEISLFGETLPFPFLAAPIGVLEMAHPQADLAVARACAAEGIPMIFSNQASYPMEECAAVMGSSPRWFQLYWSRSDDLVVSFLQRAEASRCSAIVLTLDTTLLGWRIRDLDLAYLPFLRGKGIAQYTSDPVFQRSLDAPAAPDDRKRKINVASLNAFRQLVQAYPGNWRDNMRSGKPLRAVQQFITTYSRPSLTWADLPFLRQHTRLPILLKGILHPDDARQAVDAGMDGIIVSNHGGRQVDGAIGTLDALPEIAAVVNGQIPILLDSGIRSGADAFKAIALGAAAVCIGRPYVYGLAIAGEAGVREVLKNFMADFHLTMGLTGCASIADIMPDLLRKVEP